MSSRYIDGYLDGYMLSGVYQSITIGQKGVILGNGVYGGTHQSYTITNNGSIGSYYAVYSNSQQNAKYTDSGISLLDGGVIFNHAGGRIEGEHLAIYMGSGTVNNAGTIIANDGTVGGSIAIRMTAGGLITNAAGAMIEGKREAINIPSWSRAGVTTIINSGKIESFGSEEPEAIQSYRGGFLENEKGAYVGSFYAGVVGLSTIVNAGTIRGVNIGICSCYSGSQIVSQTELVINEANALITGADFNDSEFFAVAATTVSNAGTIIGDVHAYTITNSGRITGGRNGLVIGTGGSVSNTKTGIITCPDGIYIGDDATLVNSGSVVGTHYGIRFLSEVDGTLPSYGGTVINGGVIQGYIGVDVTGGGTIVNFGTIAATGGTIVSTASHGMGVKLLDSSLNNGGLVEATGSAGIGLYIAASDLTFLFNTHGTILSTGSLGIAVEVGGGSFATNGLIEATGSFSVGIELTAAIVLPTIGTIVNGAHQSVTGYSGVVLAAAGVLTNAGTIIAAGSLGTGVSLHAAGTVTNAKGGLIDAISTGVMLAREGTLDNAGTIRVTGSLGSGTGVLLYGTETVTNATGGVIDPSGGIGIAFYGNGTAGITNAAGGLIAGEILGRSSFGSIATAGAVSITNSGTIRAEDSAIVLDGAGIATNSALGLIAGAYGDGLALNAIASALINAGTVSGGIYGSGVALHPGDTVFNRATGLITGATGIAANGVPVTTMTVITNNGTIRGTGGDGVDVGPMSLIDNAGTAALIEGTDGVVVTGRGTVTNFGTIAATGGGQSAVVFQSALDVLIEEAGSRLIGKAVGDNGVLDLAGTPGTLSGLGGSYSGFSAVDVLAHAAWTFTGTNTLATGTANLIDNGALTLDGASMLSGTLSGAGTLTLAAGSVSVETGGCITVADLDMTGGTATLQTTLIYTHGFIQSGGGIALGGNVLDLTGNASLTGGTVAGAGYLETHGTVALAGLTLAAGAVWQDDGPVTETGTLLLGNAGGGTARLAIGAGTSFDITGGGGIAIAAGGGGIIGNEGLLEKTAGAGTAIIAAAIANAGTILAAKGTLDLGGLINATGRDVIGAAGTLRFDGNVTAGQTVRFAGTTGGDLVLNDPHGSTLNFAGLIAGFGGADMLDLATFGFGGGPEVNWTQNGDKGTLTVTDGAATARIALFGQYTTAGFGTASDDGTGTLVTYTAPTQQATLANPQR